ncbi:esterase OVCA2-like [Varroa destructor]|uniref:Serine hydrolase domain-containing protein n=1 Tax=Varroa destructor TaxID=109461 RepID=A0A7M7JFZ6_VARDE|nr:esterase OVCA2-like [Varroa destructor]
MSGQKLRILALHGYQQDAASFRSKCGAFRQKTKSLADYVIIDAPLIIDGDSKKRGWLYENVEASASDSPEDPTGLQSSLDAIGDAVVKEGPFDGIFAFSQGASLACLLLHFLEKPHPTYKLNPRVNFRFIVCVCGVEPRSHQVATPIEIPSLHLIGKTDQVISPERARAFSRLFKNPEIFEYDGGHHVPASGETGNIIRKFLTNFLTAK